MGCDIHCYAEQRIDGQWQAVAKDQFNPHEDRDDDWETNPNAYPGSPDLPDFHGGRDYDWFGFLADVRYRTELGFGAARGLPDGVSPEVVAITEHWEGDAHSHSYQTLAEFKNKAAELLIQSLSSDDQYFLNKLRRVITDLDPSGTGNPEDFRIVYFFDN